MLTVLIIDDEKSCIDTLESLIAYHKLPMTITATVNTLAEGIQLIHKHQPQLVFLDVEIGSDLGFDLFDEIPNPTFKVIFTTGHREYALQAIKASCIDFLVKPIDATELEQAAKKATQYFKQQDQLLQIDALKSFFSPNEAEKKLAIHTSTGYEIVHLNDIVYFEANSAYTFIYLQNGKKYTASKTLKEIETSLPMNKFFRCHRTFTINLQHVQKLNKTDGLQVILSTGMIIDVSTRKKEEFLALFEKL